MFHPEVKSSNNPDPCLSDHSSASPEVKPGNKPNPWLSDDSSVSPEVNSSNNSSDFEPNRYQQKEIKNLDELPKTIQTTWRYGVSLQATADIINSFLEDQNDNCIKNGRPKMHANSAFVSKNKIRLLRKKYGNQFIEENNKLGQFKCLGIDGKRSKVKKEHCQTSVLDKETVICAITTGFLFTEQGLIEFIS